MKALLKEDARNEFYINNSLNFDTCSSVSYFSIT